MRILVTRARADAERTAQRLAALGHRAILAPVIEVVATSSVAPAGPHDASIATSAHAFSEGFTAPEPNRHKPLFVVGSRTGAAASLAGFTDVRSCAGDAAALAALVVESLMRPARVLYLAGLDRKPVLEAALIGAGLAVSAHQTYEARRAEAWAAPVVKALRSGRVDAALHFSRRSATLALELARRHDVLATFLHLNHFCLSEDVSRPLRRLGAERIEVAPRPDAASLFALLATDTLPPAHP